MAQFIDDGYMGFAVNIAIGRFIRVIPGAGSLAIAGLTDREIGVTREQTFAGVNNDVTVVLRSKQGSCEMVANGAIPTNTIVYTAANGQISSTNATGSILVGRTLSAAGQAGDIVEVIR